MAYEDFITTGQNTTGKLYFQLNTGLGFTEITTSGIFTTPEDMGQNLIGVFTQPMGHVFSDAAAASGFYKFAVSKTRFYTGNYSQGVRPGCPINILNVDVGVDSIILKKGGCIPRLVNGLPNETDCRRAVWFTDKNNIIFNASWSGLSNFGDFSTNNAACYNSINGDFNQVGGIYREVNSPGCFNTILGGNCNHMYGISCNRTIAGGECNIICDGNRNFIAGGKSNCILGTSPISFTDNFIGAGISNCTVNVGNSAIVNGSTNKILSFSSCSFIGAGRNNCICNSSNGSVIGGGNTNSIGSVSYSAGDSFIGGGSYNFVEEVQSAIVAGSNNTIAGGSAHGENFIGAGIRNTIHGSENSIIGGYCNCIGNASNQEQYQSYNFMAGGCCNYLQGSAAILLGGLENTNISIRGFIGGGRDNCINTTSGDLKNSPTNWSTLDGQEVIPNDSIIVGGIYNRILNRSELAFIGGGATNKIVDSPYGFIIGGTGSIISGAPYSFIIGSNAEITATGKNYPTSRNSNFAKTGGWKISGVGVLTDGYSRYFNAFNPRTLNINFRYGTIFAPYINIAHEPFQINSDYSGEILDYNNGLSFANPSWSGQYNGYTGFRVILPNPSGNNGDIGKMIQIGLNFSHNYASDISGMFSSGGSSRLIARTHNPSVLIGHWNSGSHQNVLIGSNNLAFYTAAENIREDLYGQGISGLPVKSLRNSPWPYKNFTWPYYQGMNTLIGHYNVVTGTTVNVLGISNNIMDNAGPTVVVGNDNSLIPTGGVYLTGSGGYITGFSYTAPTGVIKFKKNSLIFGFNNVETQGSYSNIIGTNNYLYSRYGNTFGYYNSISGEKLNTIGFSNINNGANNLTIGQANYTFLGGNNVSVGNNNMVVALDESGALFSVNNAILGISNHVVGSNSVVLGSRNRFGLKTGFNFANTVLVGTNNVSETPLVVSIGSYNYVSGTTSSVVGTNNYISGASVNGIYGSNNTNLGNNGYVLGNDNKVYNEGGVAVGNYGFSYNKNQVVLAGGSNNTSWPGSSQKTYLFWKGLTSGAGNMDLMLDGVYHDGTYISGKAYVPSGVIWNGTVNVISSETGLSNAFVQLRAVTAINKNGFIHLLNNTVISSTVTGVVGWGGVSINADNTNKALNVRASGTAGKVIYWNVIGEFNEAFIPSNEGISVNRYLNGEIIGQTIAGTTNISPDVYSASIPKDPRQPFNTNGSYYPGA